MYQKITNSVDCTTMHRHTTTQTIYSLQLKSTLHVQNDTNYLHSSNSCNILHNTLCSFQFDDRKKAKMPVNTCINHYNNEPHYTYES